MSDQDDSGKSFDFRLILKTYDPKYNKRIANKIKMCKRKTATSVKYTKILLVLSEFENMSADEHIINLCTHWSDWAHS